MYLTKIQCLVTGKNFRIEPSLRKFELDPMFVGYPKIIGNLFAQGGPLLIQPLLLLVSCMNIIFVMNELRGFPPFPRLSVLIIGVFENRC